MYAGCVLIKPITDYIKVFGNWLINNVTYISCDPFWSDVSQKIDYILNNYDEFLQMRINNRKLIMDVSNPQLTVDFYMNSFQEMVS
jgi:hypothetical protein